MIPMKRDSGSWSCAHHRRLRRVHAASCEALESTFGGSTAIQRRGQVSDQTTYRDLIAWPSNPINGDKDLPKVANARPSSNRV